MADLTKDWTIIIYLAGDNNLSDDMISAIREILEVTSLARQPQSPIKYEADVAFVIEYDSGYPTSPTRRYVISKSDSIPVRTLGVPNIGKVIGEKDGETIIEMNEAPKTSEAIKELIKWSVQVQPAQNYALIISGHTDAFQGRTLLVDEEPPGITTIIELQKAIAEGVKYLPKKKLDLIGFEGCVMNTLEVLYQFREIANAWIGSQGNIPNYAWDYRSITTDLITARSKTDLTDLIDIIISRVKAFHKEYSFGGRSTDISACDLTKLEDLVTDMEPLPVAFLISLLLALLDLFEHPDKFDFLNHKIIRAFINSHWKSQTFMHDQAVDLRDFCEILGNSCRTFVEPTGDPFLELVARQCFSLVDSMKAKKVVIKGATTGIDYHFATGISMFFPWTILTYLISKKSYAGKNERAPDRLDFIKTRTGEYWVLFLALFLVLTERPNGVLSDASGKITSAIKVFNQKFLEIFKLDFNLQVQAVDESKSQKFSFYEDIDSALLRELFELLAQIQSVLSESIGGTREDQITTREGIDRIVYYFGRYRNLRMKDLNLESDF